MEKGREEAVEIVKDREGNNVVRINHIIFRGKQNIDWKAVELYLQRYIGESVSVADEEIRIDRRFVDEYTGSVYTVKLKGAKAKVKANASQGIIEMLKTAAFKKSMENKKGKHRKNAGIGWRYYKTRFAVPVYNEQMKTIHYNVYTALLVVRCAGNKRAYLYDMQEIKKETSNPPWI